jgi:hypothetical protein
MSGGSVQLSSQGQALDGYAGLAAFRYIAAKARIALAQPEPVAPTDEEIEEWADAATEVPLEIDLDGHGWGRCFTAKEFSETIRAALDRWGNSQGILDSSPQPEPVVPTDDELMDLWLDGMNTSEARGSFAFARAVLARYGTPAIEPVPVSERLPEPEDCDAEGGCWWWHPDHKEDDFDDGWILLNPKWADGRRDSDDSLIYTHWLPANALPTPEPTNV